MNSDSGQNGGCGSRGLVQPADRLSAGLFIGITVCVALGVLADTNLFAPAWRAIFFVLACVQAVTAGGVYAFRFFLRAQPPARTRPHMRGLVYVLCIFAPCLVCGATPLVSAATAAMALASFFCFYAFREAYSAHECGFYSPRTVWLAMGWAGAGAAVFRMLSLMCAGHIEGGGFSLGPVAVPDSGAAGFDQLFAFFMIVCFPLPAAAWLADGPRRERRFCGCCAAAIGAASVLAFSRAGWVALAAEAAALALLSRRRRWLLACAAAAVLFFFIPGALARAATLLDPDHATNAQRIAQWRAALCMIRESPFCGRGIGAFPELYRAFQAAGERPVPWPHNIFLHLALECGLPALVFFWAWLLEFPVPGAGTLRRAAAVGGGEEQMRILHAGAAALLAGILVFGLFDL